MKVAFVFNKKNSDSIEEAEFDTPEVIKSISSALAANGDEVVEVEMTKDGRWITELIDINPGIVFNTAEGFDGTGREALAPTVFDQLKLKYVGSGPYACFLTLDKFLTKKVVENKGVPVAPGYFVSSKSEIKTIAKELEYPVFIKPNYEGSSKGITKESKCDNFNEFLIRCNELLTTFPQGILVEKYIEGKDITVPYISGIGNKGVLEPIEYVGININGHDIYDYDLKNSNDDLVSIKCPADINSIVQKKIIKYMQSTVKALGINDMARGDFRISPSGDIYFIEINALPSLQKDAGLFAATSLLGLDYNQTIQQIVSGALKRNKHPREKKNRVIKKRSPEVYLVYNIKHKNNEGFCNEDEAEFDSIDTVKSIQQAIMTNGYNCHLMEANRDLSKNLLHNEVDIVFNIAEGINKKSREAQVPALCDLLGIEHTGSDASCLSLTLNKAISTKVVAAENILTPKSVLLHQKKKKNKHNLKYPIILKPNLEGSSKGIYNDSVVENDLELENLLNNTYKDYNDYILAEEYIIGREFTVGLLGNNKPKIIGISEIVFMNERKYPVYSYELKQIENPFENEEFSIQSPPDISKNLKNKLHKIAKKIFEITGCRDVARIDFKVTPKDEVYFIEVNPLPGLAPGFSDLPVIAEKHEMSYEQLIGGILRPAVQRWRERT